MWAHLENNVVVEITDIDPLDRYPVEFIWIPCSNSVKLGDEFINGSFITPTIETVVADKSFIEAQRLIAYANPVTGSDRYFAEVLSLQAEGFAATSAEVKEAKAKGLARKLEIQALYPWPVE